ncbi:cupin domain-containing protein [Phyllobacterium bourgognense]|nr:cupin domain-containing protein [Phyllobacterium bourgognense]
MTDLRPTIGKPETLHLDRNGWVPNHQRFPVLIYHNVMVAEGKEAAAALESMFRRNDWPPRWHDGVYFFHHYHSTAHEVLGIANGKARLMLGGPAGQEVSVTAGDVLVLPVGTGHCCLEANPDFLVVGAYPPNQTADLCQEAPTAAMLAQMNKLVSPLSDPVTGREGWLEKLW